MKSILIYGKSLQSNKTVRNLLFLVDILYLIPVYTSVAQTWNLEGQTHFIEVPLNAQNQSAGIAMCQLDMTN